MKNSFLQYFRMQYRAYVTVACSIALLVCSELRHCWGYVSSELPRADSSAERVVVKKRNLGKYQHKKPPRTFMINNFDTRQKNKIFIEDILDIPPATDDVAPRSTMISQLLMDEEFIAKRVLKLSYTTAGGDVRYRMVLRASRMLGPYNCIGICAKGSPALLKMTLRTNDLRECTYTYKGLSEQWQEIIIPFTMFHGFTSEQVSCLVEFSIGIQCVPPRSAGDLFLNDAKVYRYSQEDLSILTALAKEHAGDAPLNFVQDLFVLRQENKN